MKDVSDQVVALQPFELFRRDAASNIVGNPDLILPGSELLKFGRTILDRTKLDGLNLAAASYASAGISTPEQKAIASGRVFALDRETGKTRLFFIWMPTSVARQLEARTLRGPINFHVLFHPPTYEPEYQNTPYWNGRHPRETESKAPGAKETMHSQKAKFIQLGIRYLCEDFRAAAHHVMATTSKDPFLIYVVPVSDFAGNFSDLLTTKGMKSALTEIYDFLARKLSSRKAPQFDKIGKVMLSGYSRSGDRLTKFMEQAPSGDAFFSENLQQINAFDINLGNNDAERIPVFTRFWENIRHWKTKLNSKARSFIYTAYSSHFQICKNQPVSPSLRWTSTEDLNLESPTWTDEPLKAKQGAVREMAFEYYTELAEFGVICLPVMFFQFYVPNGPIEVGNKERGWRKFVYGSGAFHGHGLFLRGMMSHALNHGDVAFLGGPATRK